MLSKNFKPPCIFLPLVTEKPFLLPKERLNFISVKTEAQDIETPSFAHYLGYFIPNFLTVFDLATVISLQYIRDVMKQNLLI